ncbi:30S ribosomal protein S16 [Patescibacteria group bacterium]|nr:30S ribosomal protein S16 [Patescibacteria group bacterium]MBU4512406.1 30S ribosomal protein S16 [Patescibacteria group bacterium]MCG2693180.1 30S ribosomal protein S16 [Candidatus Parcubacteria bacterium]
MLTIRFARIGKKKQPYYRLIINEKTKDTFGDFLENLGHYNPRTKKTVLKADRIKYWLSCGAGTSDTVHNLLVKEGVIEAKKVKAWKPKKKETKDDKAVGAAEKAEKSAETQKTEENLSAKQAETAEDKNSEQAKPEEKPAEKEKSEEKEKPKEEKAG